MRVLLLLGTGEILCLLNSATALYNDGKTAWQGWDSLEQLRSI